MREKLDNWEEGRKEMLNSKGLRKSGTNRNLRQITGEENEDQESAISLGRNGGSGNLEFAQEDLPYTSIDMEIDNQNEVSEDPEFEESAIPNLGGRFQIHRTMAKCWL